MKTTTGFAGASLGRTGRGGSWSPTPHAPRMGLYLAGPVLSFGLYGLYRLQVLSLPLQTIHSRSV